MTGLAAEGLSLTSTFTEGFEAGFPEVLAAGLDGLPAVGGTTVVLGLRSTLTEGLAAAVGRVAADGLAEVVGRVAGLADVTGRVCDEGREAVEGFLSCEEGLTDVDGLVCEDGFVTGDFLSGERVTLLSEDFVF